MSTFKVTPLVLGEFTSFEKSRFTYDRNWGTIIQAPILAYLVQNGDRNILVDTGCSSSYYALNYYEPLTKPPEQEADHALKALGLEAGDIDTVIWTHLHWDHSQNAELFKNAEFIVQKKEIEFAVNPLPSQRRGYELGGGGQKPEWTNVLDRIKVIDGDQEIVKGLNVIVTPGHTPGFQSVVVSGNNGQYVIVSDTLPLKENWNSDPNKYMASGIHVNLFDSYSTQQKLLPYSKESTFLYAHDYCVLEKPFYD